MTRAWLSAAIVAAGVISAGCDIRAESLAAEGSFERRLPITGVGDVSVASRSGSIRVVARPGSDVHVVGRIRAYGSLAYSPVSQVQQLENAPPIEQHGNSITIGRIDDWMLGSNAQISYEVTVPADVRLRTSSRSGQQTITGVRGRVDASSRSGPITIERVSGALRVGSRSGDVTIQGDPAASWYVQTRSGDVELRAPAGAAFDLQVGTRSGSIATPPRLEATSIVGRRFSGKVRGGGARVAIETRSGSVRFE
jgi:hypothetical protein